MLSFDLVVIVAFRGPHPEPIGRLEEGSSRAASDSPAAA
jgi:hypothetical protein